MDSNPICHPSPAKRMKCLFLDYLQLLMIGRAGWWTRTPSATPLSSQSMENEMLIFGLLINSTSDEMPVFRLHSNSYDKSGWSMDSNSICHPSPAKKMKLIFGICSTSDDRPGWLMDFKPHLPPLSPAKNHEMLIFGLHSTSDDWPGWSMDLSPVCHLSAAKKMKCSFLGYVQLLMISQAGRWTRTPSATPLQPKKTKCSFLDYIQLLMIANAYQLTRTPSTTPLHPKKWNAHF